jgi:hypothetical protein
MSMERAFGSAEAFEAPIFGGGRRPQSRASTIGALFFCAVVGGCGWASDSASSEVALAEIQSDSGTDRSIQPDTSLIAQLGQGSTAAPTQPQVVEASAQVAPSTTTVVARVDRATTARPAPTQPAATTQLAVTPTLTAPTTPTVSVPTSGDPRVIYWVDPRMAFVQSGRWNPMRQTAGRNGMLADVDPNGVFGAGSDMTLSRVQDPVVPGRQAYRHRISNFFPTWNWSGWDTWRSEITANWQNDGTNVALGEEYWIAYAFKLAPDMVARGNGANQILDFHSVPDAGDDGLPSPFSLYAGEGGLS